MLKTKRIIVISIVTISILIISGVTAFVLINKNEFSGKWKRESVAMITKEDPIFDLVKDDLTAKDLEEEYFMPTLNVVVGTIKKTKNEIELSTKEVGESNISYKTIYQYSNEDSFLLKEKSHTINFPRQTKIKVGKKSTEDSAYFYDKEDDVTYNSYYIKKDGTVVFNPKKMRLKGNQLQLMKPFNYEEIGDEAYWSKLVLSEDGKTLYVISIYSDEIYNCAKYEKQ